MYDGGSASSNDILVKTEGGGILAKKNNLEEIADHRGQTPIPPDLFPSPIIVRLSLRYDICHTCAIERWCGSLL